MDPATLTCAPSDPDLPRVSAGANICSHANGTLTGREAATRGILQQAESAAAEMARVPLPDALGLVLLYAEVSSSRFERGAIRWLGRLALEQPGLALGQLLDVGCALLELGDSTHRRHSTRELARLLEPIAHGRLRDAVIAAEQRSAAAGGEAGPATRKAPAAARRRRSERGRGAAPPR